MYQKPNSSILEPQSHFIIIINHVECNYTFKIAYSTSKMKAYEVPVGWSNGGPSCGVAYLARCKISSSNSINT